jgi:hypothetical protein
MLNSRETLDIYRHAYSIRASIQRAIEDALQAVGAPESIGVEDVVVLDAAVDYLQPTVIADALNRAPPTVSHCITRLVDHGFLTVAKGARDGRTRILTVTKSGAAFLDLVMSCVNFPSAKLSEQGLKTLDRLARRLGS